MSAERHRNFYNFEANNHLELGVLMGEKFREHARTTIEESWREPDWGTKIERAQQYLPVTEQYFPQYIEEISGYAQGAGVDVLDVWTLSLEDEVNQASFDKCTTIITNDGKLIAHNEDWYPDSEDRVCVVLKKIGDWRRIFELYYMNTLGGNSISINSDGFITSVNTLAHGNKKPGLPRTVIARWLSETKNPEEDFQKLQHMPRALGFNFNILHTEGTIWNIEYNSVGAVLVQPPAPYVHTNHYLSDLRSHETRHPTSSFDRYEVASARVKRHMTPAELIEVTNDVSRGNILSIMNERTIAKMVIDVQTAIAKVWLRRENDKGWVDYDLQNMLERR